MRSLLNTLCIAFAILSLSGAHLGVAQLIAWGNMLVERSVDDGVEAAIESTFSGDHPCSMCLAIDKAKKQQQDTPVMEQESRPIILGHSTLQDLQIFPPASRRLPYIVSNWREGPHIQRSPDVPPPQGVC